jgi:hypothetical protein
MNEEIIYSQDLSHLEIKYNPQDVFLCNRMVFRVNGDIELDGRKITTDLELVNALRKTFDLPEVSQ